MPRSSTVLSPLAVAALALLIERPMHPYEMYQLLLERHEDRIVKVTAGSLYRTVEKLAETGLAVVNGTERAGNRPERTSYAITDAGRRSLVARVREILRAPVNEFPSFALALSEAHNASLSGVCADLRTHLHSLEAELQEIDELLEAAQQRGVPECFWVTAEYVKHMTEAQRTWIAQYVGRLEQGEIAWPSTTP